MLTLIKYFFLMLGVINNFYANVEIKSSFLSGKNIEELEIAIVVY